jgi:hypothetical protein
MVGARGQNGEFAHYGLIANDHANHILDISAAPAPVPAVSNASGAEMVRTVLEALDVIGVLCVEFFLTARRPFTPQRNRPPAPQLRPPDHRSLRNEPVRAAVAGRLWPAVGRNALSPTGGHGQSTGRFVARWSARLDGRFATRHPSTFIW